MQLHRDDEGREVTEKGVISFALRGSGKTSQSFFKVK